MLLEHFVLAWVLPIIIGCSSVELRSDSYLFGIAFLHIAGGIWVLLDVVGWYCRSMWQ